MDKEILDNFLKQAATKPIYKPYLPLLKLARDCFVQNPIITYWTLCYILETALKNQTKPSDEFRKFLMDIMTVLEKEKKTRAPTDSKFANEKEAQQFIEEYGQTLLEKAEENEELLDKPDVAYKLYLFASNIFQVYTVFVRDDEENAKRIKWAKWKAVECFKKKKEQEENPQPPAPEPNDEQDDDQSGEQRDEPGTSAGGGACPYPTSQPGDCPYPSTGGSGLPYSPASGGNSNLPSFPSIDDVKPPSNPEPPKEEKPAAPVVPEPSSKPKTDSSIDARREELNAELANLKLSDSDSKRAELLCESALYAIRANDLLTAVETLKQTLDLLYKRARK